MTDKVTTTSALRSQGADRRDYAELVERLRTYYGRLDYNRHSIELNCKEGAAAIITLQDERDELTRINKGLYHHVALCEQVAGKALGYPWFKDDQKNFPGATEADGVCIGEHVADTIVSELAGRLTAVERERDAMREALKRIAERRADLSAASEGRMSE